MSSEASIAPRKGGVSRPARAAARSSAKAPAAGPRLGAENSAVRAALLDAAEHLMRTGGYSAVTSRGVAAKAGLKPQLVHYYFRTMDDLFVALARRYTDKRIKRQAKALASPTPLRAAWAYSYDGPDNALAVELSALARRCRPVGAELARAGEIVREMQGALFSRVFDELGLGRYLRSPEALAAIIDAVGRGLGLETEVGLTVGHADVLEAVHQWLDRLEGDPREGNTPPGPR